MSVTPAIDELVTLLTDAGLYAVDDPAKFYPQPIGCLVGVPELRLRGFGHVVVDVPVHVVCSSPLTGDLRDQLFDAALKAADALGVESFALEGWNGGVNDSDLPAYLLTVPVTFSP